MDIQEVCTRLGLKDERELAGLLDFSDRSEKIRQLSKQKVDCDKYDKIKLLLEDSLVELDVSTGSPGSCYRQGWACVLKSFSDEEQSKEERKKLKDPKGFPKGNVPKGLGSEWYFHRGHILAYSFGETLTTNHRLLNSNYEWQPEVYWQKDITNKKDRNLFTQFNLANKRQGDIEQRVRDLFEAGAKEIFYEVKIIRHSKNDVYAIGTEIYYKVIVPKDDFTELDEEHYFIPNLDQGFCIETANARQLYRDFYAKGYKKEDYKEYFENSDRKQWQVNEEEIHNKSSEEFYLVRDCGVFNDLDIAITLLGEEEYQILSVENSNLKENEIIYFTKDNINSVEKFFKKAYPVTVDQPGLYFDWNIAKSLLNGKEPYPTPAATLKDGMSDYNYTSKNGSVYGMRWINKNN